MNIHEYTDHVHIYRNLPIGQARVPVNMAGHLTCLTCAGHHGSGPMTVRNPVVGVNGIRLKKDGKRSSQYLIHLTHKI